MGVLAGATVDCGVALAGDGARVGTGVATLGALLDVALAVAPSGSEAMGMVGSLPPSGVRSADGATGCGAAVGRAVGVGVLVGGAIRSAGARIATGTTAGSPVSTLLSRSAASTACALGGGIGGIAPISQA